MQSLINTILTRPLLALAAGLALAISSRLILPIWLAPACLAAGSLLLIGAVAAWLRFRAPLANALFLAAGLALGLWRGQLLFQRLADENRDYLRAVLVEGRVTEDFGEKEVSGRRALRLSEVMVKELGTARAQADTWAGDIRFSYEVQEGDQRFLPGDTLRAWGSLRRSDGPMNPGEFDYRGYLLGRGITASMSGRKGMAPEMIASGSNWDLWRLAWQARLTLVQGLERHLSPRASRLARGMVLGDTGGLSAEDMSVYARTGLVHILSVSGLHLALALAIFIWLGKWAGLGRKKLAWLALVGAFFYGMVCGMPVPCQRALFLFGLALLGRALDLETDLVTSLAFGAVVILLQQPGALFEAGCQLSFLVSLSLVTLTPLLAKWLPDAWPRWLKFGLSGTLAAELAAVPLVAWHFSMLSWPSLFASLVTAPLMGPIVGLGLGTAALGDWLPFGGLLEWCLGLLDWLTARFAALPYAAFSVGKPPVILLFAWAGCTVGLAYARRILAWTLAFALLCLVLLWPGLPWAHTHSGLTKTWFFAVGQGDGSLTEFEDGKTLLVDAGPLRPDAGSWVIGPALRRLGINRIDWAVVTHPHIDHYGGMVWVAGQFKVGQFLHSGEDSDSRSWFALKRQLAERGIAVRDLSKELFPPEWKGRIQVLSPLKPRLEDTKHDMHNNNVVLNIGGWMLLTGDLQLEGERRLLSRGLLKPLEILKIGHHGSRTSSSPAFLRALQPQTCVIQCGPHNRYRHPSPATLKNLRASRLLRTDLNGCIAVEHDASETRYVPWRAAPEIELRAAPPKVRRFPWKRLQKQGRPTPEAEAE